MDDNSAKFREPDIMVQLGHCLLKKYYNVHTVIRFAMGGCANRPYFRIVAAQNKRARDGKHLEQIGCYDPLPNGHNERIVGVNFERLKYWIANGAHLTKPVEKLLGLSGFFPLHPMTITNAERVRKAQAQQAERAAQEEASSAQNE
ncbi:small ribosomal subunit protein bS16m isoform X1 [Zootoca vivipara]|uniref:small ribosomal subunit protein bS16m isoform X1 n=2 Tax=Zootoca vivipara TaxID=8524 RepID=UPI00159225DE|nr:small ribosomal subunit protein bS16m isoform X1 [Zootoca vivipara]